MRMGQMKTVVIPFMDAMIIQRPYPLPQFVEMINFIPITKCSPKSYCDRCRTARTRRKILALRCSVNRHNRVFFYKESL